MDTTIPTSTNTLEAEATQFVVGQLRSFAGKLPLKSRIILWNIGKLAIGLGLIVLPIVMQSIAAFRESGALAGAAAMFDAAAHIYMRFTTTEAIATSTEDAAQ